nr:putative ribonuclease H-like domain-containing protein [Tanacetum cinerariifolium]
IEFCGSKRIKREYGNAKTTQQNRVAERKNRTLIEPITAENKANKTEGPKEANNSAGTQDNLDAVYSEMEADHAQEYLAARASSTNYVNTASTPVNTASTPLNTASTPTNQDDSQIPSLEDIYEVSRDEIFTSASYDDEGAVVDFINLKTTMNVSPIATLRIHSIHPTTQILRNPTSAVQTRSKVNKSSGAYAFGHRQEEGIDYDEVFALVARIEAIWMFLAFASYMGFIVYQMDVKSAFLYGKIDEEEVYVSQSSGFIDPKFPHKVYKVVKALYGLHQAPRACVKTTSTPIKTKKPFVKDEEAVDVDAHLYRSMISSLMYLTTSRPDIMYAVYACSRFQVTPKTSHLQAVKRIFRKSTTGGCQFLGMRLILWQCKKQTIVATSTVEAEYVAAASCCGQVLWIHNQMLDYGFIFMNTHIYIDNESTICIVKNPVFHSKTKHIEIRHHFIRDAYEKKLIHVLKIHTDDNVADLLTKAFNVSRFNFLIVNIMLLNQ